MNTAALLLIFSSVSQTFNLPKGLLEGLCFVESGHVVSSIHIDDGGSDSLGVCQIKVATANTLGFSGSKRDLINPRHNIFYAGKYLRRQLNRYGGDVSKAVAAYNSGTYRPRSDGKPKNFKYVNRVLLAQEEYR